MLLAASSPSSPSWRPIPKPIPALYRLMPEISNRSHFRPGDRVYCLSHPGGNHFMFTQGMIARVNRRRDELPSERDSSKSTLTRPLLFLNVTAEFAPGSSGAAIVDESANVVGQVS